MISNPKRKIDVTRAFDAPVSALYNLCGSTQFFRLCGVDSGPGLFDFRVGGRYDFRLGSEDFIRGEFKEIVPYEKIVFSWTTNTKFGECTDTLVTLLMRATPGGSELRILHEGFARDDLKSAHDEGWETALTTVAKRFKEELASFLGDKLKIRFKVAETFAKPVREVFNAFISPEMLKSFFVASTSGPLTPGSIVEWTFRSWQHPFKIHCTEVIQDQTIKFSWGETRVTFMFEAPSLMSSKLTIHCEGWAINQASLDDSYSECEGWRQVLDSLKAKLQYGIDL